MPGLPRVPKALLSALLPARLRDEIVGDLEELYRQRLREGSRWRARAWAWRRAFGVPLGILIRGRPAGELALQPSARQPVPVRSRLWNGLMADVRVGCRTLQRSPGFTFFAVLSLALGIAANATVFSVIDSALFRPLPFPHAERLVEVGLRLPREGRTPPADHGLFREWRAGVRSSADAVVAYTRRWRFLEGVEGADEEVLDAIVSAGFFEVLGARADQGRLFTEADYRVDGPPLAVVSHGFWSGAMRGDPDVLGRRIELDGAGHTIVGVLAPELTVRPLDASVFTPLRPPAPGGVEAGQSRSEVILSELGPADANSPVDVVARLREGATPQQLVEELRPITAAHAERDPGTDAVGVPMVRPLRDALYGWVWDAYGAFMGVVAFVLLLVAANLANLTLVRSTNRRREMAVRTALGAGRWRLARQIGIEILLVSGGAAALGILLTRWGITVLLTMNPQSVARVAPRFDLNVVIFAATASLLAGLLAALWPIASAVRADLRDALQESSRQATGGGHHQLVQRGLVVVQIAGSLLLLTGAGLLTKTTYRMQQYDPGIEAEGLLRAQIDLPDDGYDEGPQRLHLVERLLDRLRAAPGVVSVSATAHGSSFSRGTTPTEGGVTLEGRGERLPAALAEGSYGYVSADHFETLGVPVVRGRGFTSAELQGTSAPVALVNQEAARRWWPEARGEVVGERFKLGPPGSPEPWITIVGVVRDTGSLYLTQMDRPTTPRVHLPLSRSGGSFREEQLYVRTIGDPAGLVPSLRAAADELDPDLLLRLPWEVSARLEWETAYHSVNGRILLAFAAFGLLLAAMGIWGVVAYRVARRTREIGIRKALGAEAGQILRTVSRESVVLALFGIAAGLALSAGLTRVLESMLFGVSPLDPLVFAVVSLFLAVVVGVATYLPARRATSVDPVVALRGE